MLQGACRVTWATVWTHYFCKNKKKICIHSHLLCRNNSNMTAEMWSLLQSLEREPTLWKHLEGGGHDERTREEDEARKTGGLTPSWRRVENVNEWSTQTLGCWRLLSRPPSLPAQSIFYSLRKWPPGLSLPYQCTQLTEWRTHKWMDFWTDRYTWIVITEE